MRLTCLLALLPTSTACGRFKEQNWQETAAEASCRAFRRCNAVGFYNSYDALEECVSETIVIPVGATGCSYDRDAARECVRALGSSCETLGEQWDEVDELCRSVSSCLGSTGDTGP